MSEISNDQIRSMMQDVAQNAANISILMNGMEDQRADTKKILSYLENDPMTGRKGLFAVQQDHESRLDAIEDARENEKTKQKVWITVATVVGGLIMSLGSFVFKLIFNK